jgi:GDP-4-dehydro-6-deoxy-D-mannose reductase
MSICTRDRALITGVGGFTGPHLAKLLLSQGLDVFGLDRANPSHAMRDLEHDIHLISCDLLDRDAVYDIVQEIRPAYIFHLASASYADDLAQLLTSNVLATDHLIRAASRGAAVKVFIPGSAAEYGLVRPDELPITEQQPLRPVSPYGISKTAQILLAQSYFLTEGVNIYIGRPFNLIGPGAQSNLVCSAIAHQIVAIEQGLQEPVLRVGNLASERDFVDVRDVVRAYWAIVNRGRPGEFYNICSGSATPIRDVLDTLLELANVPVQVQVDAEKLQRADVPKSVGDGQKLRTQTGWEATISLAQSLADMLDAKRMLFHTSRLPAAPSQHTSVV